VAVELEKVTLERGKGRPTVEVIFANTHLGTYRAFLWDPQGKNPELLSHGNNVDDVIDTFDVPREPADVDQRILSYEVLIQAPQPVAGQVYGLTLMVRQQGQPCHGGIVQETGTFTDAKSLVGFRRFTVVP
jgi:hypothetical protein